MARKPNKSERLKRLLEAGMFPEELPPPFVTQSFAKFRASLGTAWQASPQDFDKFRSRPEPFGVPRTGASRRRIVIVNPVSHLRVSKLIADGWVEIRNHIANSQTTEFRPILDTEGQRAIFGIDFEAVERRKAEILSDYRTAFQTDITRFYASIYTHSIAWALYTKPWVKANRHTALKGKLGDKLDFEVRKGQDDQSIGIPIGPDTSRVISEIIAVGLERELKLELQDFDRRSVRYVDDLVIGFDEHESEDKIASAIEAAVSHYELDINVSKTKILGADAAEPLDWISELRSCGHVSAGNAQRQDLERFFRLALHYADEKEKDAVLKWALKRSRSFLISNKNYQYYCDLVIRIGRKANACLPLVAQILIEANSLGRPLPTQRIKKFITDLIRVHAPIGHAFETSWALFLSKGLRIQLSRAEVKPAFKLDSSVCALLCMDLDKRGLVAGGIDDSHWLTYATADGLASPMWLVAYEAAKKGWWSTGITNYVETHPLFGPMYRKGVYFYDTARNVRRTQTDLRLARMQKLRTHIVMSNWQEYF